MPNWSASSSADGNSAKSESVKEVPSRSGISLADLNSAKKESVKESPSASWNQNNKMAAILGGGGTPQM